MSEIVSLTVVFQPPQVMSLVVAMPQDDLPQVVNFLGTVRWGFVTGKPLFGTAALQDTSAFATAAQGALADTALQDASDFASAAQGVLADTALQDSTAFATAAQGGKADTALQDSSAFATATQGALADTSLQDASAFATAAQGALADTALQPGALGTLGSAAAADVADFATAAQGALADTALQDASAFATSAQGGKSDTALQDASAFATAAQGGKADTALQDASAFATAAQGGKADTAVQPGSLGSAASADAADFATAAQGGKADTALQDASAFATAAQGGKADTALQDASAFATAAQGGKADTALQDASAFATFEQGAKADSALQDLASVSGVIPAASLTTFADTDTIQVKQASGGLLASMSIASFKAWVATWLTKVANLVGGNTTNMLGAIPYQSGVDTTTLLAPNTATSKQFLSQTGTGAGGAAPAWSSVSASDVSGAVGTWERKTGGFNAANGGRYFCDCSSGSITVSDPSGSPGTQYECIVFTGGTANTCNIGGVSREESAIPILRRYNVNSWVEPLPNDVWVRKSGNFTAAKGGRYKIYSNLTITEPSSGNVMDDTYEFIVTNSSVTATIGANTFGQSMVPYVRRNTSSSNSWETVPSAIGAYLYKTGSFTAEVGKDYLVVGSGVSVSDPSGNTGNSYTVVVAGSSSTAIIGGTTCYESSLPYVRRYTGVYTNGSYWVTVPFAVPSSFYSNGPQNTYWQPNLSNGLSHSVSPMSSGSWYLSTPSTGASEGKVMKILFTGYYSGGSSLSFSGYTIPDSGGIGYASTPISIAAYKKCYLEFTYLGSTWVLTNIRYPFT